MRTLFICLLLTVHGIGCGSVHITEADVAAAAASLNLKGLNSSAFAAKAWQASSDKEYAALFATTRECERRFGTEAKKMNARLQGFATPDKAAEYWALNDVGTCLFIMGHAYVELSRYAEAARVFERLARDYTYSQCWDPKGWFWHPADGAERKSKKYHDLSILSPST